MKFLFEIPTLEENPNRLAAGSCKIFLWNS